MLNIDVRAQALARVRGALVGQDGTFGRSPSNGKPTIRVLIPAVIYALRCIGLCAVETDGFLSAGPSSMPCEKNGDWSVIPGPAER